MRLRQNWLEENTCFEQPPRPDFPFHSQFERKTLRPDEVEVEDGRVAVLSMECNFWLADRDLREPLNDKFACPDLSTLL